MPVAVTFSAPTNPMITMAPFLTGRASFGEATWGDVAVISIGSMVAVWLLLTVGFWLVLLAEGEDTTLRKMFVGQFWFMVWAVRHIW
jgi:hypothetical protein